MLVLSGLYLVRNTLVWNGTTPTPKPTQADLDGQWAAVKAQIEANAYKEQRAKAYPSIADQLDTIYHEGLDAWKATILAVKEEFPK
jgi:hypothetical protein